MPHYLAIMVDTKLKAYMKEDITINQNTLLKDARFELMDNCSTFGGSR